MRFEDAALLGTPLTRIELQTARGGDIANEIRPQPGHFELAEFERIYARNRLGWNLRKGPCGRYNCAGMVWASRRTSIFEASEWQKILADDGYRRLPPEVPPEMGDLAIYESEELRAMYHVAVVTRRTQIAGLAAVRDDPRPMAGGPVWVLSKWSDWFAEVEHHVQQTPNSFGFSVTYWTDREIT